VYIIKREMEKFKQLRIVVSEEVWRKLVEERSKMILAEGKDVSFSKVISRILEEYFKCGMEKKSVEQKE